MTKTNTKNINGKIETKILKISDIKNNPKNPKKHDDDFLDQSFKEMGYVSPMIIERK